VVLVAFVDFLPPVGPVARSGRRRNCMRIAWVEEQRDGNTRRPNLTPR
jgi:hypothetical protein